LNISVKTVNTGGTTQLMAAWLMFFRGISATLSRSAWQAVFVRRAMAPVKNRPGAFVDVSVEETDLDIGIADVYG
jgi:hypothetical protein